MRLKKAHLKKRDVHPKKLNGQRTARYVRKAITSCNCADNVFFATAYAVACKNRVAPGNFKSVEEAEKFAHLENWRRNLIPGDYKIPKFVILFTEAVLESRHPERFFLEQRMFELSHV